MTYQQPTQHYDDNDNADADESSSLVLPSFSLGHDGDAKQQKKKTNGVPTMRARIVTCIFLLGTLAVLYLGGSSSSGSSNTHRRDGTPSLSSSVPSLSSLSSLRTATLEECHPNGDPCYGGYWFLTNGGCCDTTSCVRKNGGDSCDVYTDSCVCVDNPTTAPSLPPTKSPTNPPTTLPPTSPPTPPPSPPPTPPPTLPPTKPPTNPPTTSPPTSPPTPPPTLPPTPAPTPPPTLPPAQVYDPSQDFCFKDNANVGKLCWCPTHSFPVGNWGGWNAAYDNCGPQCTRGCIYDPSKDFCFKDNDNVDKYCWYPSENFPCGNWKGEGGHGYNDCGPKCTKVHELGVRVRVPPGCG